MILLTRFANPADTLRRLVERNVSRRLV